MKNTSVYRAVVKDLKTITETHKMIVKDRKEHRDDAFLDDYYFLISYIQQIKIDLRNCKKELEQNRELFEKLCKTAIASSTFSEKDVVEILCKNGADYSAVFVTELMVKCAVLHKIAADSDDVPKNIEALRRIREYDFEKMFRLCREERILEKYNDFNMSDSETKMLYRKKAYENALKKKMNCCKYLDSLCADNIGDCLFLRKQGGEITLILEVVIPLLLSIASAICFNSFWFGFILFLPFWQISSALVIKLSMCYFKTEALPRVKKSFLTERNSKTLIVISALLTDEKSLENMKYHIEKLYYSNCNERISLCVLADLKGSQTEVDENDEKILTSAERTINRINKKCDGKITCVVRPRRYSKTQNEFMGRERKRGAIEDLVSALKCGDGDFLKTFGAGLPENVQYILALDSDTDLTLDCADELLQTALHPVNCKRYGVFTMRTEIDAECSASTLFSRIMAGDGGITAYHSSSAERYQDVFGKSIFSGKGLIKLDDFYEKCCGTFEPETVLSHDILEGELLLTAYASRCQALELFPTNQMSYLKRLHRWVRGDWQNVSFIFDRRLSSLSKFKLFDNLRRSITPLFCLICIIACSVAPRKESALLLVSAVSAVVINDIVSFLKSLFKLGSGVFYRRFFSGGISQGFRPILRGVTALAMLPAEAAIGLDGAVKGVYRRFISKRNMLLWTTAQQGEASGKYVTEILLFLPNIISAAALIFSDYPQTRFISLLFLANIPFALLSGKKQKRKNNEIGYSEKEQLVTDCKKMWMYYADFATPENNFLPPDNVQFDPMFRVAKRTSPTNIGLMMASALSSYDLNVITLDELCEFIENTLSTVEKLQKWHGNLYNWYDIETLERIEPYFISTVDSGNFLCSITALKNGLEEIGEKRTADIIKRLDRIVCETDLYPLYNEKNGLLCIGYDIAKNKKSDSYYDLLMSEARMTSYFAVASRHLPKSQWEALGRTLTYYSGFSSPASWTGTMFEFFMPNIFLPAYKNTIEYEALNFCLFCQEGFCRRNSIPFGISESGYYDFDGNMNYRYKANGIGLLGMKRYVSTDLTVSPYSTYLVLPFDNKSATENLNELRKIGAYGKYGFYEAVDFTPSSTINKDKNIVKSFMAHHLGMSILSVDNALNDNIMQRRFMRNKMQAGETLLRERVPNRPYSVREKQIRSGKIRKFRTKTKRS